MDNSRICATKSSRGACVWLQLSIFVIVTSVLVQVSMLATARASDNTCPNTDAPHATVEALGKPFSGSAPTTSDQANQLIVSEIKLSTAYMNCATGWVGKDTNKVGFAEFEAADWEYVAAQMENLIGQDTSALNDLDDALSNIDDAIGDATDARLLTLAKRLRSEMTRAHDDWQKAS